ncbi:hypothetical protein SAMN05216184_10488 [Georgenia satyanarayanai]|uniref:Uncharacterized protein n=1 Tax=Georgenia satyanarayanai TaxID=860221 RepID=A0A2Y9C4X8_9MICO|nr:hypothetical protein [Georgenia satyanarayanai]PYG00149.1 hypothetical protein A8987_10488 [Georgenia satyanarayanai]SSA40353.1 hypothetical protein SAMN05216184_10488 [Georgenia satyanarayanai]
MSDTPVELPVLDTPPKSGTFAPELAELEPTPEEVAAGNELGVAIDPDDDDDNGGLD